MTLFHFARQSDPKTSHAAAGAVAESGVIERHERMIVAALLQGPASKCGISRRCCLTEQQVNRRLAELRRRGVIERTGKTALSDTQHREAEYRIAETNTIDGTLPPTGT